MEQYDKEGNYINEYPSAIEASRILHLNVSGIVSCCNESSKYSHCGGYQWRYKDSTKIMDTLSQVLDISTVKYNYSNAAGIVSISENTTLQNVIKILYFVCILINVC